LGRLFLDNDDAVKRATKSLPLLGADQELVSGTFTPNTLNVTGWASDGPP
jgi:hypothetical protein